MNAQLGEQTICKYYGAVLDERLDAQDCWFWADDPEKN